MRKIILALFFLGLFATTASAQKEFASIELQMRNAEDLVTVADDEGYVCVYFFQGGNLNFRLLSPTGKQVAQHEVPYRFSQDPQILGTRVTDEEFIFYSRHVNGRREYVRPFAINRQTGAFRSIQDQLLKTDRNFTFIGGFGDKEHFYMLYTDRKYNLHLFRDSDAEVAQLERRTFEDKMPRARDRDARLADLIYVYPDMEQSVFTGHHRSKIYARGDKIYMIFDGYQLKGEKNKATTEILTLDWNTNQTDYRTLPFIEQKNEPVFNSFLFENTLFRVQLEKEEMKLMAFDFTTLQPKKEYNYQGEEEITIKATPVLQRGAKSLFSSDKTIIEKTSKVMKKLASGVPAITVDNFTDNSIQLTIGSYEAPQRSNMYNDATRMVQTPSRYIQTSRGLMLIPGRWVPAYSVPNYYLNSPYYSRYFYDPYRRNNAMQPVGPGTSTYFRAVLDGDNLEKVSIDKDMVPLPERIMAFEEELKPEPDFKTMYRYGDKLHYAYYDRRNRTFRIMEFALGDKPQEQNQQQ